jgi:nucleoside-diphosphate-sugar epimerase
MKEPRDVLLVGAGRFGSRVARALLAQPDVRLRVLVREAANPTIASLRDAGASIVAGELGDARILDDAARGVEVVVSTLNGGPDVIVDGQTQLLRASERQGVKRFVPSDYSLDYFALGEGDNVFLDLRRRFARVLEGSAVAATHVLIGAFAEVQLSPSMGIFDFRRGVATPWGTGDEPVDVTTLDDAARVVAAVALDERAQRRVAYAGDVISARSVGETFERLTGRPFRIEPRGSVAELEAWIARTRATAKAPTDFVFGQYQLAQINGKGKLRTLDNARFPQITPTSAADVLRGMLGTTPIEQDKERS